LSEDISILDNPVFVLFVLFVRPPNKYMYHYVSGLSLRWAI
jgi:hypothetical protein